MAFRHHLVCAIMFAGGSVLQAATYTITDLGTLGGSSSEAFAINAGGQVVGRSSLIGDTTAAAIFSTAGNLAIPNFGSLLANEARGINSSGVVVGANALADNLTSRAFVYLGGALIDLGTLGGASSRAFAINDSGQITGEAQIAGNTDTHAFRYQNGAMIDLGGSSAVGYGINAAGHVVGRSNSQAFLATGNTVVNISGIGSGNDHVAYAINDHDQIVGRSNTASAGGTYHAFLHQNGTTSDLGALGTGNDAAAFAINNSSQIVGRSNLTPGGTTWHAFIDQGGQMTDLNTLIPENTGWELQTASAINSRGQIAGSGTLNGQTRAFLLSPITQATNTASGERPRIYINGAGRITTERSSIRVEGSVGGPVIAVKYRVGQGAYRPANGGTNGWRFTARLRMGRNVVQVIAIAADGSVSYPAKLVALRQH